MHLSGILTTELAALRKRGAGPALDIIETGTIRNTAEQYRINDGWSTLTLAQEIREHGGTLTSIDLDTTAAVEVLTENGVYGKDVRLIEGHSIDVLTGIVANAYGGAKKNNKGQLILGGDGFADVVFLDSDNNGALIFHEYLIAKKLVRTPGLIIVDDVDITSTVVVKGHEILPWALDNEIPHRIIERAGDGYRTGVLVFEV